MNNEFSLKDYYIELYSTDNTFISRIKVSDESILNEIKANAKIVILNTNPDFEKIFIENLML